MPQNLLDLQSKKHQKRQLLKDNKKKFSNQNLNNNQKLKPLKKVNQNLKVLHQQLANRQMSNENRQDNQCQDLDREYLKD